MVTSFSDSFVGRKSQAFKINACTLVSFWKLLSWLQTCLYQTSGTLSKPLQGGGREDLITATSGSALPWSCCNSGNSELKAIMTTSRKWHSAFCNPTWIFQSRRITSCKQKLIRRSHTASIYTAFKIKRWRKLQNRILTVFFLFGGRALQGGSSKIAISSALFCFQNIVWLRTKRRTRKV